MYNIREQVSDRAGRKLRAYCGAMGLTNSQALTKILDDLVIPGYEPMKAEKGD